MYSPEAISRDLSTSLMFSGGGDTASNNGFKNGYFEGDFFKSKEMCGSDLFQSQAQQQTTWLARYRSAPSSYFASYLDGAGIGKNNATSNNSDSSESDTIISAFLNCNEPGTEIPHQENQFQEPPPPQQQVHQLQMKVEVTEAESNPSRFVHGNRVGYQSAVSAGGGAVVGSYAVSNSSGLLRQSSSPAGFFAGYDVTREVANFRNGNGINGETSSSTSGLITNMSFPPSSSSMFMPSIAENGNEALGTAPMDHGQIGNANANQGYVPGYQNEPWNDSRFNSLKRSRDDDLKMYSGFNPLENMDLEPRNQAPSLTHHLSLPKPAANASAMDKYLQFQQDSVPCKIRAKRGFATHPRSIAERMRRTRISEKMKKLTDLFPNLDKQANTADMLDLAVDYIKDLQTQVQALTETRAKCICPPTNLQGHDV